MTFTVTYRNKNGGRISECFEAESRSVLFEILKERQISVIRIENGITNNKPSSGVTVARLGKKILFTIMALIVTAAIVFVLIKKDDVPEPVKTTKKVQPIKRDAHTNTTAVTPPTTVKQGKQKKENPIHVKKPGTMQLPDGRVLTFPVPKPGEFRIVHSHGAIYKCDHEGNWEDVTPKPVFDNFFEENLIGMSIEKGTFIPGIMMGLNKDEVLKMLKKPVHISPEDTEDVIRKKTAAAEVKELALDYMETTGASFDDFVMEMRKISSLQRGLTASTLKDIVGFLKKGDVRSAALYRDTLNAKLKELGLPTSGIPKHINDLIDSSNNKK